MAPPPTFPPSLTAQVLQQITDNLASRFFSGTRDASTFLHLKQDVSHSLTVLAAISSNEVDEILEAQSGVRKTQQFILTTQGSGDRHHRAATVKDTELGLALMSLGYAVPATRHEWQKVSHSLVRDLRHIFDVRIVILRIYVPN
jgi:hypothetical protein